MTKYNKHDYKNTLHFDQYSRLAIPLTIFRFSAINSKTNSKFEKKKTFH